MKCSPRFVVPGAVFMLILTVVFHKQQLSIHVYRWHLQGKLHLPWNSYKRLTNHYASSSLKVLDKVHSKSINIFNQKEVEFIVRTTCGEYFRRVTKQWLFLSLKLFFPFKPTNWVIIANEEERNNKECLEYNSTWPYPILRFQPGSDPNKPQPYGNDRHRMYWSYFYPEQMTNATYVAWVDTDAMLVSPLIPNTMVTNGTKPIIIARIGAGLWDYLCWSDQSEFFIRQKEAVQCMSFFPVFFKVAHIIEMRKFIEKLFQKPFDDVYATQGAHCQCQFSIICNYLWYYHREEYDWHLQTFPNTGIWKGEMRQESQVSIEYVTRIPEQYKVPMPRVIMHARHYLENGHFFRASPILNEPHMSRLKKRLREGLCFTFGFDKCPQNCKDFSPTGIQRQLYEFEHYAWHFDSRCLAEQRKHYGQVKEFFHWHRINYSCTLFNMT